MKNTLLKSLIVFASAIFILSSCGKYEEGPKVSLASKKARVANKWKIDESFTNGEKDELDDDDRSTRVEFAKDGKVTYSSTQGGFSLTGTWEFSDDKEEIKTTFDFGLGAETTTAKILKLKSKEMWLQITDEDGTKSEIHYVSAD